LVGHNSFLPSRIYYGDDEPVARDRAFQDLYAAYAPKFVDQAFYYLWSTEWNANKIDLIEKEAREQGALSRGEGTETGIRPHIYENHLTEVRDSDPCSAPLHGSWKGSFSPAKSPLPPAFSLKSRD
jgi:hypothetical protein